MHFLPKWVCVHLMSPQLFNYKGFQLNKLSAVNHTDAHNSFVWHFNCLWTLLYFKLKIISFLFTFSTCAFSSYFPMFIPSCSVHLIVLEPRTRCDENTQCFCISSSVILSIVLVSALVIQRIQMFFHYSIHVHGIVFIHTAI